MLTNPFQASLDSSPQGPNSALLGISPAPASLILISLRILLKVLQSHRIHFLGQVSNPLPLQTLARVMVLARQLASLEVRPLPQQLRRRLSIAQVFLLEIPALTTQLVMSLQGQQD